MIHIGEVVKCGRNRGRVGAIISYKNRFCIVTAAHVVKGDKRVQISGIECNVATVIEGYDLVIIEARDAVEYVEIGKPAIGDANLFTTEHTIPCRIQSISSPIY
ncbi:MAG: hypothetical protein U9N07_09920, partial [Euryarchaeota archaeon]|nr:hypothetical protein [Euryarchaeota archaeon]